MTLPPGVRKWGDWYFVDLNSDEIGEIDRQVNGKGGIEDFLRALQKQVNHSTKTVKLSDEDLAKIPHFAFDMKQGGWETQLMKIFGRALGPRLGREDVEPPVDPTT